MYRASAETDATVGEGTTLGQRFGVCPFATAQQLISGKWAVLVLHYLQGGPLRFNELLRRMPQMTHATLSSQLKTLVANGLVERRQYEEIPPRVEYSLTESGASFRPVLDALEVWARGYMGQMGAEREACEAPARRR